MKQGLIYIFTGDGKGKTSAALGTVVRGLGNNWRVGWVSLYKEETWRLCEQEFFSSLHADKNKNLDMFFMGKGFYIKNGKTTSSRVKTANVNNAIVIDDDKKIDHKKAANLALQKIKNMLLSQTYDLIIMDELCNALDDKLLSFMEVRKILEKRKKTHIVITGRNCPKKLIDIADLVSEIKKIKHPFDTGINAVKGLDF